MRLIDADMEVTAQLFDDMHEEYREVKMPISVFLDLYTNEGCPSTEPKQGEWIGVDKLPDMVGYKWYRCTYCDFLSDKVVNFCPNCGVKMFPTQMSER